MTLDTFMIGLNIAVGIYLMVYAFGGRSGRIESLERDNKRLRRVLETTKNDILEHVNEIINLQGENEQLREEIHGLRLQIENYRLAGRDKVEK